ncbi:MAG TPA: type II toxin-antitoxin system VapC family toxin [Alicyclobacillus sp.]|nr:type II toxin-antitoxin system VapC family toxin [Alicyclobacillus sp.]
MPAVLDACAVIAFLRNEEGADVVEVVLRKYQCLIHAMNVYEVYLDFLRATGDEIVASSAINDIRDIMEIRNDLDEELWKTAAHVKLFVRQQKPKASISVPDCFAVALARRTGSLIVTADHAEFSVVHDGELCPVIFFRQQGIHLQGDSGD